MIKDPTPTLALVPAGLFFCLGLQTVLYTLERVARDACLILQLSSPTILLVMTTISFVATAVLALLTLKWLRRCLANEMTGGKIALRLALAYVLAVALQFAYTYGFYDNTFIDVEKYAITDKDHVTYLENLNTRHPLLLVARSYAPLDLIYLMVTWRCLK